MAQSDKVEHLAKVPLFSACTDKELTQIAKAAEETSVAAGTAIVTEGDVGTTFHLILDGQAVVSRAGTTLATLGPGQYFGELAVLEHAPRNATVAAATDLTLATLEAREFEAILDMVPGLARKLLVELARRVRQQDAADISH